MGGLVQLDQLKALYKLPLSELLSQADKMRCDHFGRIVSYSLNYTIPVSNYCRNNCDYCAFRPRPPDAPPRIFSPGEIQDALQRAYQLKCWEVLFLTGEGGSQFSEVQNFLADSPWNSIEEYYLWGLQGAVATGLLPHSNFGLVDRAWLEKFKPWNASMGLMLETTSVSLCLPGMSHQFSPGKDPTLRLQFICWAGELRVPFTTGLLIGVGEDVVSRLESLLAIGKIAQRYGHIQEVILQNFVPNPLTPLGNRPPPSREEVLRLVAVARLVFKGKLSIQIPPNLNPSGIIDFIRAGANDLGGISPSTIDFVNPRESWAKIEDLTRLTSKAGFSLIPRLPVYDSFISDKFLSPAILRNITSIQKEMRDAV